MNEPDNNKSIKDGVLQAIQDQKVTMRPKWVFMLEASLLVVGSTLAGLSLLYVVSFTIFVLHQTGVWFTPGIGLKGIMAFLQSLPWVLLLVSLLFIVLLEAMVKKYSFGYRKPLLYTTVIIIGFVVVGGFVVAETPLHQGLFKQARNNNLPVAGRLYREFGIQKPTGNIEAGVVTEKSNTIYLIKNRRNEIIQVITDEDTDFQPNIIIQVNDSIVVIGHRQDDYINADAIKKINEKDYFRPEFIPKPFPMQ